MEEKELMSKVAGTILNRPVTIKIDILRAPKIFVWAYHKLKNKRLTKSEEPKPAGKLEAWLERFCVRTFEIKKGPLSTLIKVSEELLEIDMKVFNSERGHLLDSNYTLMKTQGRRMARIAAIAVSNPIEEPPEELIKFFLHNLNAEDLQKVVSIVFQQMDIGAFMTTIISIKGTNVLQQKNVNATNAKLKEVSQLVQGEIIAPFGEQSAGQ